MPERSLSILFTNRSSLAVPRIHHLKTAVFEVFNISRRESGAPYQCNGRNLRFGVADRFAPATPPRGNLGKYSCRLALEPDNTARQVLGKRGFRRRQ